MSGFIENSRPRVFAKGTTICSSGVSSDKAYVILSGRVAIEREADGRRTRLSVLRRSNLFGEMMCSVGGLYFAVALSPAVVSEISGETIRKRICASPPVVRAMAGLLRQDLCYIDKHLSQRIGTLRSVAGALFECSSELHGLLLGGFPDPRRLEDIARRATTLDAAIEQFAAGTRLGAAFLLAGWPAEVSLLADGAEVLASDGLPAPIPAGS